MFLDVKIEALDVLLPLALILLLSKLLQMGCKKVKLPQVVGMLLAGIIIGFANKIPGLNLLPGEALAGIKFLAEIGVVLIMFSAGLETNIGAIKSSGLSAIIVTLLGVVVPLVFGFLVAGLFNGFSGSYDFCYTCMANAKDSCQGHNILTIDKLWSNLFYGVILTATSVSVSVATLKELGRLNGKAGTIIVSAAILDDIIGVIVLSIVLSMSGTAQTDAKTFGSIICKFDILAVFINVIVFFIFTIALGILVHKFFKYMNKKRPHTRRIPIFGLAFAFFMSFAAEKFFGIADITGAYFAGLALAGIGEHINPAKDELSNDTTSYIERKSDVLSYMIFSPVFFAKVGITADFSGLSASLIGLGVCFIFAGLLGKVIGCGFGAFATKNSFKDSFRIGIGMMARAEVALICATKGMNAGLINPGMSAFIVIMIIVSSFVTPLVLKATYKNEEPPKTDYKDEIFTGTNVETTKPSNSSYLEENVEP